MCDCILCKFNRVPDLLVEENLQPFHIIFSFLGTSIVKMFYEFFKCQYLHFWYPLFISGFSWHFFSGFPWYFVFLNAKFDDRFSTFSSSLYCFMDSFLLALFLTGYFFFSGSCWIIFSFIIQISLLFYWQLLFFDKHKMALLPLTVQWTFINCISNYSVSR